MINFKAFSGKVTNIVDLRQSSNNATLGCYKLMTTENDAEGIVNFVVSPSTYFVDAAEIYIGDNITGYYDGNAPTPLIYPPQYQALIIAKNIQGRNVKVDFFNSQLISSDGTLKLNIAPSTHVMLTNYQPFNRIPLNKNLIVIYGPTTKSIPAQTTPYKIIVLC